MTDDSQGGKGTLAYVSPKYIRAGGTPAQSIANSTLIEYDDAQKSPKNITVTEKKKEVKLEKKSEKPKAP